MAENSNAVIAITGATSGIGFAVARALLSDGFSLICFGRNGEKCAEAESRLGKEYPGAFVRFICRDLMRQSETIQAARDIEKIIDERFNGGLYALISNAGCVRSRYMTTEDGYEQQFALNYLAGFLLTHELRRVICRCGTRIIFTSSASHKLMRVNWDDLMYQRRYRPLMAYKQSKLMNMLLVHSLRGMGFCACGVDPGLVRTDIGNKDTAGIVDLIWKLRKKHGLDPSRPAEIYRRLCGQGFDASYYGSRGEQRVSRAVCDKNAQRLYDISLKLCGLEGGYSA